MPGKNDLALMIINSRLEARLLEFRKAVNALPGVAERLEKGQQFNAYDSASNDDDDTDEDCEMFICVGRITDTRIICKLQGRTEANMVAAALTFTALTATATSALQEENERLRAALDRMVGGKCPECRGWAEIAYFGEVVVCGCRGNYHHIPTAADTAFARAALSPVDTTQKGEG